MLFTDKNKHLIDILDEMLLKKFLCASKYDFCADINAFYLKYT